MDSKFNIIIFGASGCVGKHMVLEAVNALKGLTWAIAGRSREKLEAVLMRTSQITKQNLNHISILLADANKLSSIEMIAKKCEVLINCCGPYQLWAERIIDICIKAGTHYVDMCNDAYFNELMELRYHKKAVEHSVYIVSSCGFQSFPMDIALNMIKKEFNGTVNYVDAFVTYEFEDCVLPICPLFTVTTWFSLIWSCALAGEMPWLREELREKTLPHLSPKQPERYIFHKRNMNENSILMKFPFIDLQVVERSQYLFFALDKERPIQFYKYMTFPTFFWALIFLVWFIFIALFSQFDITRKFLISYPRLFSVGICSSDGPNEFTVQSSSYTIILKAKGWSKRDVEFSDPLNRHLSLEIKGYNPFYGCGCICLLLASRCLVEEKDKLPNCGGVYSPGYAFHKTKILELLQGYTHYYSVKMLETDNN